MLDLVKMLIGESVTKYRLDSLRWADEDYKHEPSKATDVKLSGSPTPCQGVIYSPCVSCEKRPQDEIVVQTSSDNKRAHNRIHPSSITCLNKSIAPRMEVKRHDITSLLYFVIGLAVEEIVLSEIEYLFDNLSIFKINKYLLEGNQPLGEGVKLLKQFPVQDKYIIGTCDGIVTDKTGKPLFGIEMKTCSPNFVKGKKSVVKEDHLNQTLLYSLVLGVPFIVLYVDRNVATYRRASKNMILSAKQFVIDASSVEHTLYISALTQKAIRAYELLQTHTLEYDYGKDYKRACVYCDHRCENVKWESVRDTNSHIERVKIKAAEYLKEKRN